MWFVVYNSVPEGELEILLSLLFEVWVKIQTNKLSLQKKMGRIAPATKSDISITESNF